VLCQFGVCPKIGSGAGCDDGRFGVHETGLHLHELLENVLRHLHELAANAELFVVRTAQARLPSDVVEDGQLVRDVTEVRRGQKLQLDEGGCRFQRTPVIHQRLHRPAWLDEDALPIEPSDIQCDRDRMALGKDRKVVD